MKLHGDLFIQDTLAINVKQWTVLNLISNILYSFTGTFAICNAIWVKKKSDGQRHLQHDANWSSGQSGAESVCIFMCV